MPTHNIIPNKLSIKNEGDKDNFIQKTEFTKENLIKKNSKENNLQKKESNPDGKI